MELIATPTTEPEVLDRLETFVTSTLGKAWSARTRPTSSPTGSASPACWPRCKEAQNGLSYDVVDDLTGKKMGRASSGTFRTADVVGLDTLATWCDAAGQPGRDRSVLRPFASPRRGARADRERALGQSVRRFTRRSARTILRLTRPARRLRALGAKADEVGGCMLKRTAERLKLLRNVEAIQGAVPLGAAARRLPLRRRAPGSVADNARDVDLGAMRWGFGEAVQARSSSGRRPAWLSGAMVQEDIDAKALSTAPLPAGCSTAAAGGAHAEGQLDPSGQLCPRASCRCMRASLPRGRARLQRAKAARGTEVQERGRSACGRWTRRSA